MKTLHYYIIAVLVSFALFVTSPAYASCIEGLGIDCNHYPPQALTQIHSDKLSYGTSDKPVITIVGDPSAVAHLEIDDSSSNIMLFTHDINLAPNGTVRYVLDISSYKPGVYSAIATSPISKLTSNFAVGLSTTGPSITLNVLKDTYVQGNFIAIIGTVGRNDTVQLSLIDPNDNVVTSIQTVSNDVGQYSTSALRIPTNAIPGIWKITADHNVSHTTLKITVQSSASDGVVKSTGPVVITLESPLKQFKSGIPADKVECNDGFVLTFKSKDSSPMCVKPATANVLIERGWAFAGFTRGGGPTSTSTIQVKHADMIVVEDTGTTVIGNQTYYFTTLNDTITSYHGIAAIPFTFHGVDFTLFPSVFSAGPPGSCGDTNFGAAVKFANMTYERLDVHIPGSPCIENYTETAFTNHENSQVGIEDYYGKIRLLVSGDIQPSSALQLSLLVNDQYQNPSEPVGIDVYLNNTTSKPLTLTDSGNWPRNDLTSGMCSNLPFGISILDGYYDEQNMTGTKSLLLYGTAPCPFLPPIKSYTFEPFSTKATQECDTLFSCTGLVDMKKHFDISDYVDGNNPHQPFKTGTYTIIAGDKWGNVAIQHFTETNAVAYDNSSISKGN